MPTDRSGSKARQTRKKPSAKARLEREDAAEQFMGLYVIFGFLGTVISLITLITLVSIIATPRGCLIGKLLE